MRVSLFVLAAAILLISCKKNKEQDKIMNGVNATVATSVLNSYRTQGTSGHPAVGAVTWNDTLSLAAYSYAKAKTEDVNTPSSIYQLSDGRTFMQFPLIVGYSKPLSTDCITLFPLMRM